MIILKGEQPIKLFDEFLLLKRRLVTTQFFFLSITLVVHESKFNTLMGCGFR